MNNLAGLISKKMKHKLILLSLIFLYITSYPQMATITIQGINNNKAYLFSLEGEKTFLIDSINTSGNDNFVYSFVPSSNHSGFYRLAFNNKKSFDFVYDREVIQIKTDANNILDNLEILKSESIKFIISLLNLIMNTKQSQNCFS